MADLGFKASSSGFRICASDYTPASQIRLGEIKGPVIVKMGRLLLMSEVGPSPWHLPAVCSP